MSNSMKDIFYHPHPTRALSALFLCLSVALTACNDKYPKANIPDTPLETPLEIIIEPKKVAMTKTWAAGIKDDGTLWTWGSGAGKIRSTTTGNHVDPTPMPVEGINDAVAISGGISHMLLLRKDGSVWAWGFNYDGVVDPKAGTDIPVGEMRKVEGLEDIVDISAGSQNSFFVNKQGEVYVTGNNETGLYGEPSDQLAKPTKIETLKDIVKIKGNPEHFLALDKFGNLYSSSSKAITIGGTPPTPITYASGESIYPPIKLNLPKKVVDFDTGYARVLLLEDGTVWSWGGAEQSAQGTNKDTDIPTQVQGLSRVVRINKESAVTVDGNLYIWGEYAYNCSYCFPNGMGSMSYQKPTKIADGVHISQYVDGFSASSYVDNQGWMWTWGGNYDGKTGNGKVSEKGRWADKDTVLVLQKSLFTTH